MSYREFHPPHIYRDKTFYFITSRTVNKINFFNTDYKKDLIKITLNKTTLKYLISLYAWVILDNHYHLLFYTENRKNVYRLVKYINGASSNLANKLEGISNRKI